MIALIVKRLIATAFVMAFVAFFVFGLLHLAPGDPAAVIAGDIATKEDIERIRATLGLDLIMQRVEPTLALTTTTILLSVVVAIPLGIVAAWRSSSWIDRTTMGFAVLGFSVPVFVFAYLLIMVFAAHLKLVPVMGYVSPFKDMGGFLRAIALPTVALGVTYVALIARITRASMLEAINQDYIRTAHAKGLGIVPILFRHALRNASVPIVTTVGIGIALLIGGVVVTESVFAIPGLGRLTADSILRRDYPIVQGVILIFSGIYVLINLTIDIIYILVDPRIRY